MTQTSIKNLRDNADIEASSILFGKATKEGLEKLDEQTFMDVFEGVPQYSVSHATIEAGASLVDLAAEVGMFESKDAIRRELKQNSISVNKQKVAEDCTLTAQDILASGCILVQKGKKNYYLLNVES